MKVPSEVDSIMNYFYSCAGWPLAGSMTIQQIVVSITIALLGCMFLKVYVVHLVQRIIPYNKIDIATYESILHLLIELGV